jgi:hypothetical protein
MMNIIHRITSTLFWKEQNRELHGLELFLSLSFNGVFAIANLLAGLYIGYCFWGKK